MHRFLHTVSLLLAVLLLLVCLSEAGSSARHTRRPAAGEHAKAHLQPHTHKQRVSKSTYHTSQGRERDNSRAFDGEGTSHLRTPLLERVVPLSEGQHLFEPAVQRQLAQVITNSVGPEYLNLLRTAADNATAPEQIKVTVTARFGEVIFNWLTWNSSASDVTYGTSSGAYTATVSGISRTFVDPNTLHLVRYFHDVLVPDLQPLTTYYYRVGDANANVWSEELTTRTVGDATSVGARAEPLSVAWYGDLGLFNSQSMQSLSAEVAAGNVHAVVHVGDYSYNMDELQGMNGDWFFRDLQNVTAHVPYMGCPGNHEQAFNFSHYANRFSAYNFVADPAGKADQNWWFSYDMISNGVLTHYISLDTELYYWDYFDAAATPARVQNYHRMIADQWNWLVADLAKAYDSGKYGWIVAFGHRPIYCSNVDDIEDCTSDTENLRLGPGGKYGFEAAFNVRPGALDIYFAAHEHSYERTYPTYNGTSDLECVQPMQRGQDNVDIYNEPKYTTHIIAGSAGCREFFDVFDTVFYGRFSAFRSASYGWGSMTVHNATHLHWSQKLDEGRGGTDQLWIVKKPRQQHHPRILVE